VRNQDRFGGNRVTWDHAVEIAAPDPAALRDDAPVSPGRTDIERQHGNIVQEHVEPGFAQRSGFQVPVEAALQLGEAQRREKNRALMTRELLKDGVGAVPRMNRNVGIEEKGAV
jgi:hypothetical protein